MPELVYLVSAVANHVHKGAHPQKGIQTIRTLDEEQNELKY